MDLQTNCSKSSGVQQRSNRYRQQRQCSSINAERWDNEFLWNLWGLSQVSPLGISSNAIKMRVKIRLPTLTIGSEIDCTLRQEQRIIYTAGRPWLLINYCEIYLQNFNRLKVPYRSSYFERCIERQCVTMPECFAAGSFHLFTYVGISGVEMSD